MAAPGQGFEKGFKMASADKVPMLEEGFAKLTDELKRLRMEERPAIVEAIEVARAHGDLSENAEYHAAKERQGHVEATIADLEDRLSRAMVIDPTTLSGDKVLFGATVTLIDEDKKKVKYQLVGQTEADAKVGRISYNSPLGRALIGRHAGEEVEVSAPGGDRSYEIKKIEFV
jgi:transcription elongation factor GreA